MPRKIVYLALFLSPIAGALNILVDIFQQRFHFWHYTFKYLVFNLPLDFYISVSLMLGVIIPIIYWWIKIKCKNFLVLFLIILPIYFLGQDYLVISLSQETIISLDKASWWLSDLVSLTIIIYGTLIIFQHFLKRIKN